MVYIFPREHATDYTATVRALSSLTSRDCAAIRAAVRSAGNRFTVEEHDDYDGYRSVLLTPLQEGAPAFLVSGRSNAVDLAELHGDDMVPLGRFPSIGAAMLTLRPALEDDHATDAEREARHLLDRHGSDAALHAAMRADAENEGPWRAVIRAIDRNDDLG